MMMRLSLYLLLISLILLILIPIVWWIGEVTGPPYWLPPPASDWVKCLPAGVFKTQYWTACFETALRDGFLPGLEISFKAFVCACISVILSVAMIAMYEPPKFALVRGRKLLKGPKAKIELRKALQRSGKTGRIQVSGGVSLPESFETRHWLIFGAVGAGKTVFLRWLIEQFLAEKQRVLLLDVKGDFVQDICSTEALGQKKTATLLNPFDDRSAQWWLGSDITNVEMAREFTKKFLSESTSDPFWSKATGNLAVAVIRSLQIEKGLEWSWSDLAERICAPLEQLQRWAELYYQPAVRVLESSDTEAAQSVLINFSTDLAAIGDIATYWNEAHTGQKVSLKKWLRHQDSHNALILGWDASRETASKSWASAFIDLAGMVVASPQFQSSTRTNLVLDEFAQLPQMTGVLQALDVGRSKGVSVLIGVQSFYQLLNIYGKRAESFRSLIGNHVFAQMAAGKDAEDASRFLGNQTMRERQISFSKGGNHSSTTTSWQEKERPIMTASEFGSCLGPNENGVKVVYTAIGHDAYILHYPFPSVRPIRSAFVPAIPKMRTVQAKKKMAEDTSSKSKANPFKGMIEQR